MVGPSVAIVVIASLLYMQTRVFSKHRQESLCLEDAFHLRIRLKRNPVLESRRFCAKAKRQSYVELQNFGGEPIGLCEYVKGKKSARMTYRRLQIFCNEKSARKKGAMMLSTRVKI